MDISVIVNIALCILSFILAVISVVTVVVTLRQNSKMIENATRPYITIYFDYSQMGEPTGYFVIKNFGTSSAIIRSIKYSDSINQHPKTLSNLAAIFDGLAGNSIAPSQKYLAPFKLYEALDQPAIFDITYSSAKKIYRDHFVINVRNYGKLVKPRLSDPSLKAVSYPLQEIAERLM